MSGVMSAATCDVCGHALHGLNEMCGADHYGDTCECDGRWHFFCACDDRFETVTDLTEHGRLCPTIAENEDCLVEGGHLDPSARLTPAPNAGWRRSEPAVIQTADPFGPDWDQRKAEAAAAGLAVAAILAAAGDGTGPQLHTQQNPRLSADTRRGPHRKGTEPMSTTTAPLTMAERAALASDLAGWITEAGGDIKSLSVYPREGDFFGCAIVFQVGGNEAGVDACADLLSLGNPDARTSFYRRSGTVRGLSVAVFSTRSKPVCTCIAGCHHAAVTA